MSCITADTECISTQSIVCGGPIDPDQHTISSACPPDPATELNASIVYRGTGSEVLVLYVGAGNIDLTAYLAMGWIEGYTVIKLTDPGEQYRFYFSTAFIPAYVSMTAVEGIRWSDIHFVGDQLTVEAYCYLTGNIFADYLHFAAYNRLKGTYRRHTGGGVAVMQATDYDGTPCSANVEPPLIAHCEDWVSNVP